MKAVGRFFLVLNFIFVFISFLVAISFKFQLLDSKFWVQTFEKHHVYEGLQKGIEQAVTQQIVKEGGSVKQAKLLTNFLQENTLKDFLEKNFANLDNFLNGKDKNLAFYIPTKSLPPGFLPKNLAIKNNSINIENLAPNIKVAQLSSTGTVTTISLLIAIFFVLWDLWGFYRSNDPGTNLIFPGGALITTGIVCLILIGALNIFRLNMARELLKDGAEGIQILLGTIAPPIILEVSKLWVIICGAAIAIGIGMLFIKKPPLKRI